MASFLLGYLSSFFQASGQFINNRDKLYGFYAQDSWKLDRKLTLNYGLRYEPAFPWHEKFNRVGQFNPAAEAANRVSTVYPNAPAGLLFVGDAGMPRDGYNGSFKDFSPASASPMTSLGMVSVAGVAGDDLMGTGAHGREAIRDCGRGLRGLREKDGDVAALVIGGSDVADAIAVEVGGGSAAGVRAYGLRDVVLEGKIVPVDGRLLPRQPRRTPSSCRGFRSG